MSDMSDVDVMIREVRPEDHEAVLGLAPRLTEGVAAWRDPDDVRRAVLGWVAGSLASAAEPEEPAAGMFVAVVEESVIGFVSVGEREHFTGQVDGYVGELVVAREHEGHGVGGRLMERAETWSRARGLGHLTLETGAANTAARRFYAGRGYAEEDVRLTRPL